MTAAKMMNRRINKLFFILGMGVLMAMTGFLGGASKLKVGTPAPEFTANNQKGESVSLAQFKNKKAVVLYFYPKDDTPGCTAEACAFRDSYEDFQKAGAEVIGVSSDSASSHVGFASKYHLPFQLLSDTSGEIRKAYKVGSTLGVLPGRVTFVIDSAGIIQHIFSSQMQATKHRNEALEAIQKISH